jgi:hypothetical protein
MKEILAKIGSKKQPKSVPVLPENYSIPNDCFHNVKKKIRKDGGDIIYGWKIHQLEFMQEAERHAIWKSPNHLLIDITPDENSNRAINFLEEDNGWEYNGDFVDNIRVNTTINSLVDDFILISETITKLYQTGKKKANMELILLEPILNFISALEQSQRHLLLYIKAGNEMNSLCYCGKLNPYQRCHGFQLKEWIEALLKKSKTIINQNKS